MALRSLTAPPCLLPSGVSASDEVHEDRITEGQIFRARLQPWGRASAGAVGCPSEQGCGWSGRASGAHSKASAARDAPAARRGLQAGGAR